MEDQGIMALPAGGMQAPTAQPPAQGFDPATAAAFEQMRNQVSPKEFSAEMLSAAEQADPAAVQQLKQALTGIQLPQEVIDAMQQMVEVILRDPQNYSAIRQEMLSDGIPADLLPEQFDPMFFGALRVALDQVEAEAGGQPVQAFAMGGIANLRPIAQAMQGMGRGQDTMLAHINPQEARVLQMMGGIGTINPRTGLREYGLFKSIGNAFKSVGKAISGAVKGIVNGVKDFAKSSIGRIVTSVALGFFLGPAAAGFLGVSSVAGVAAVSGFVGGFGSSVLAGSSFKDALKNGAIGGVTAGATAGITGGMGAFEAGSYAGPTTVAGQWDKAINSGKSLLGISTPSTAGTSISAEQLGTAVDSIDAAAGVPTAPTVEELLNAPKADLTAGREALSYDGSGIGQPTTNFASANIPGSTVTDVSPFKGSISDLNPSSSANLDYGRDVFSTLNTPTTNIVAEGAYYPSQLPSTLDPAKLGGIPVEGATPSTLVSEIPGVARESAQGAIFPGDFGPPQPAYMNSFAQPTVPTATTGFQQAPSATDYFKQGEYLKSAQEAIMPTSYSNAELLQSPAFQTARSAGATYGEALKTAQDAYNPSMLRTYGPIAGAGLGAAYLGGAFTPEEPGSPNLAPKETGTDLLRAQPGVYGTTPGGANVTYASLPSGYNYNPMQMLYRPQVTMGNPYGNIYGQRRMFAEGGIAAVAPAKYNLGGYASGGIGSMAKKYPRRTGQISGPGTGTSDDIPAMLSDGEFVMTAKAVRGAGKGSRREGAKRMYAMMRKLEGKA
jgi:hypothetical protein